jgi:murein DD-endopeptidase MepM/ murein hydrolase activator NlpD
MFARIFLIFSLLLIARIAVAQTEIDLPTTSQQGAMVIGKAPVGSSIWFKGRQLKQNAAGQFVFGFGRDEPKQANVVVRTPNGKKHTHAIQVSQRKYAIENIRGVPQNTVTPDPAELKRMAEDERKVVAARTPNTALDGFAEPFLQPVANVRLSGFYGSQRVLNGVPKRPHFGLDMAAASGTKILSPASGIVRLAEPAMFLTGGTVAIDHGHGISTTYLHMSRLDVRVGQVVARGETIGAVGMTGRATGPHLCWRLNFFGERLDPQLVLAKP